MSRNFTVTGTLDGSVVALPTPGHSPGHTSYLVRTGTRDVLLAGDVTHTAGALEMQRDQGFIADAMESYFFATLFFDGSSAGFTYVSWNGPMACTCTTVWPLATAQ
jgi:hypothetical protein